MPVVAVALLGFTHGFEVRELKALGKVEPFSLTASNGDNFTLNDLHKKVWIASFIFTRCGEQCPRITHRMEELQKQLYSKESIRLVSFSVDPTHDSVDALSKYVGQYHVRPERWVFLTGDPREMEKVVVDSFKLASEVVDGTLIHSSRLALVSDDTIRGYYDAFDDAQMKLLVKDAKSLLRGLY